MQTSKDVAGLVASLGSKVAWRWPGPDRTAAFVEALCNDLSNIIAAARRPLPQPQEQKDAHLGATLAWFPGTPVILAAPLNSKTWLAQRLDKFGEAPCAILLRDTEHPRSGDTIWFNRMVSWFNPEKLEGIQFVAFECRRMPLSPNPDPTLSWI